MAVQEISLTIDWGVWIPTAIAMMALFLNVVQMRRKSNRDSMDDMERRIDVAKKALAECEANLIQCGREKDELRREKFALLEQIARMSNPSGSTPTSSSDSGGGSG